MLETLVGVFTQRWVDSQPFLILKSQSQSKNGILVHPGAI